MATSKNQIKDVLTLITKLQNFCEGFDASNKAVVYTSKIKILLELSKQACMSPSVLVVKLGMAKTNLAMLGKDLINDGLIQKTKDSVDTRGVFYSLTSKGKDYLNNFLVVAQKNFDKSIAYTNKEQKINKSISDLLDMVK